MTYTSHKQLRKDEYKAFYTVNGNFTEGLFIIGVRLDLKFVVCT